ncbi:hypothetical protein EUGRSUZ_B03767 [Eucalyptus grandis]|uniref:Uncharacterized protein n=2 Tax=Eucalyptus grandis TaxID=71139 RepID=A0ACC3LXD0_EUCGR|nr:hypothetical protein EUGRSUZ_B03767 [Eucalyptus grandis]
MRSDLTLPSGTLRAAAAPPRSPSASSRRAKERAGGGFAQRERESRRRVNRWRSSWAPTKSRSRSSLSLPRFDY